MKNLTLSKNEIKIFMDDKQIVPKITSFGGEIISLIDSDNNALLIGDRFDNLHKVMFHPNNPSGVWTDGNTLILSDTWNHRVLIWQNIKKRINNNLSFSNPDVIIGQRNLSDILHNAGNSTNGKGLFSPSGVFSNGNNLWISDTSNRRILFYESLPNTSFKQADDVIGQKDFCEKEYNLENAISPSDIKVSSGGELAVCDPQCNRVLIWNKWEDAFNKKADVIIGQRNFESNGINQNQLLPSANTLKWCQTCKFNKKGIFVVDSGNSRILYWNKIPTRNNLEASVVIGQNNFESIGEMSLNQKKANPKILSQNLLNPYGVEILDGSLFVSDTGNERILEYDINQLDEYK